ncbi:MAG: hypothetical protein V4557_19995 [Bacteroidota bacterium]
MAIFLAVTLVIELLANVAFPALHIKGRYRNAMYNIFLLVEFMFYTYFLRQANTRTWIKKIELGFLVFFPVLWVIMVFDKNGITQFHGAIIATGGFFIVCFSLAHLYFLSDTKEFRQISRIPEFWISIGLIIFYCCQTPYMGSMVYLVKYHLPLAKSLINLSLVINILMYCLFGYAFLCQRKNYL